MSKWKRPCGCIIDASETGSGVRLCHGHSDEAKQYEDDIDKIRALQKRLSTPD